MNLGRAVKTLLFSSLVSGLLFIARATALQRMDYWYLNWNLFLAWVPLLFAYFLVRYIAKKPWLTWQGVGLTFLWLVFLPNSFYLATDFIHLLESPQNALLFDVVLILSFTLNGFLLGYITVLALHQALLRKLAPRAAHGLIAVVFLLCSFAIYLGRYLRWNTWDIISNPLGLLFDVSERFINPSLHEQTFRTTALFFVLITTFYVVLWQLRLAILEDSQTKKTKRR